ncbi:MAG: DEAD/DEAH box helicase [Myxococcales bacterium]|nr:DEAD/DEAH box helicase [Myxococcales bacterium]
MSFSFAHPSLRRALAAKSYAEPTPVQASVMAPEAEDRDLLVSAQTGSGKTVAFGLALAKRLLGETERLPAAGAPRALIVAPTRELAIQVHRELSWLYAETGARITTCVGGMDPRRERDFLARGVHIVVGTPGRLCDHLERGALVLSRIEAVVLDEADEMLDMGFREDLERLLSAAPADRRTLLFSATIPKDIATLAKKFQKNALRLASATEGERHRDIEYVAVSIVPRERDLVVVNLLRYHDAPGSLVFCNTRDGVTRLAANLNERGFSVASLSGELSQRERNQALQALRDGRARVCVATDVAARGLDLPDLGVVIHADLPQNREVLVHRSGRTGRAGRKGVAVVLATDQARRFVERMFHAAHLDPVWKLPPNAEDIRIRDQDQLVLEIRGLIDSPTDDDREVARTLLADRNPEDLVAALVNQRRQARPSPEELTIPGSMRPRRPGDAAARPAPRPAPRTERPERASVRSVSSAPSAPSAPSVVTAMAIVASRPLPSSRIVATRRPIAASPSAIAVRAPPRRIAARAAMWTTSRAPRVATPCGSRSTSGARRTPIRSG